MYSLSLERALTSFGHFVGFEHKHKSRILKPYLDVFSCFFSPYSFSRSLCFIFLLFFLLLSYVSFSTKKRTYNTLWMSLKLNTVLGAKTMTKPHDNGQQKHYEKRS